MATEMQGAAEGKEFGGTRLLPEDQAQLIDEDSFSVFVVHVKSESEIGKRMLDDPLTLLRENAGEMGIPDTDARAQVLRANAGVPANPVRRSEVWIVYPGSTTPVGVQYKYDERES